MRHLSVFFGVLALLGCQTNPPATDHGDCDCPEARLRGPRLATAPAGLDGAAVFEDDEDEHPYEPVRVEALQAPAGIDGAAMSSPVFFGLLHAHTMISDGSGEPEDAYERARQHVDFMAITPHNHSRAESGAGSRRDGVLIANTPELYTGPSPVTVQRNDGSQVSLDSLQDAASSEATASFVTLFGQEFSTISSGNHVNVIGAADVLTIPNGDYRPLYESFDAQVAAGAATPVVQMNHPNVHTDLFFTGQSQSTRRKMFNDYGFDEYGEDFSRLVDAADDYLVLIELLSGPAMLETPRATHHYSASRIHDEDYYYYLIQGLHLSPSVGHDNHFVTFGNATPARMGVLAADLSEASLLAAMRANRTFATEDSDLQVELRLNGQPMGSAVSLAAGAPVTLQLEVLDPTDPNTQYEVDLFYGDVQPQDRGSLFKWKPEDGLVHSFVFDGDGTVPIDLFLASGVPEFFYARLQQGDDDRAWTAPVWINHPR